MIKFIVYIKKLLCKNCLYAIYSYLMLAPLEREDKNDVSICIMQAYLKALKFRSYIHNLYELVIETVLIK